VLDPIPPEWQAAIDKTKQIVAELLQEDVPTILGVWQVLTQVVVENNVDNLDGIREIFNSIVEEATK
jgi:hypothetical protein